jgi:hypothetical protein
MSSLAEDLKIKQPVWNRKVSKPSCLRLLELFVCSNFQISTPQFSMHHAMHYPHDGSCGVLGTVVYENISVLEVTLTDILDSDHLPITFSILDPLRTKEASDPVEKLTD